MMEWWTNLEPDGMKTFVGIGAVSSAILFIQMLIVLAGGYLDIPDLDFDIAEYSRSETDFQESLVETRPHVKVK